MMRRDPQPIIADLSMSECLGLLTSTPIGRLCVIADEFPLAFPVNYRLVPDGDGGAALVVRTRPGGVLDQDATRVGFEIDGIDAATNTGWSVLVRGMLHHADASSTPTWLRSWDPRPWIGERDAWLYITPSEITGRRLLESVMEWSFEWRGYL